MCTSVCLIHNLYLNINFEMFSLFSLSLSLFSFSTPPSDTRMINEARFVTQNACEAGPCAGTLESIAVVVVDMCLHHRFDPFDERLIVSDPSDSSFLFADNDTAFVSLNGTLITSLACS